LAAYRTSLGDTAFFEQLAAYGFPNQATAENDYANAYADVEFAVTTYEYGFYPASTYLFLREPLPASSGSNELNGVTYYGYSNGGAVFSQVYTFTASDYTFNNGGQPVAGKYSYDSSETMAYLKPETYNSRTPAQAFTYYSANPNGDASYYPTTADFAAGQTNKEFYTQKYLYVTADHTLQRRD
jgi:hypothetical protein